MACFFVLCIWFIHVLSLSKSVSSSQLLAWLSLKCSWARGPAACHSLPRFMSAAWMPVLLPVLFSTLVASSYVEKGLDRFTLFIFIQTTFFFFYFTAGRWQMAKIYFLSNFCYGKAQCETLLQTILHYLNKINLEENKCQQSGLVHELLPQ